MTCDRVVIPQSLDGSVQSSDFVTLSLVFFCLPPSTIPNLCLRTQHFELGLCKATRVVIILIMGFLMCHCPHLHP